MTETREFTLASNNGDIGGGEVMLLAIAEALLVVGARVSIVGPAQPSGLVDEARLRGFHVIAVDSHTRLSYMSALRSWDRQYRSGILWCNGLLPAVATAFRGRRIVHLHQRPLGVLRLLAMMARVRSMVTLVPSTYMAKVVKNARILSNWVEQVVIDPDASQPSADSPVRLGFLGRPSTDKGIEVLVAAVRMLDMRSPGRYQLVVGGESRFVGQSSRDSVDQTLDSLGGLVERTGWISPKAFFEKVDILVCPSIWHEAFGLVVAESMSAGVPIVVSDAGALPEVVGFDHPWIAKAGDVGDLARVIELAALGNPRATAVAFQRWQQLWSPRAGRERVLTLISALD